MGRFRCTVRHRCGHLAAGFTLVELMITVAVLAVVAALAAPSFANLINRNRLTAAANEIVASLQTARIEAVRRNRSVVMCPSTDGTSCSGSDWTRSIVFSDQDGDNSVDAGVDEVIRDVSIAMSSTTVTRSTNVATNDRISFTPAGLARVGSAGAREGAISICSGKLPVAGNTRDIDVAVSRIGVSPRDGTSACTAKTD